MVCIDHSASFYEQFIWFFCTLKPLAPNCTNLAQIPAEQIVTQHIRVPENG